MLTRPRWRRLSSVPSHSLQLSPGSPPLSRSVASLRGTQVCTRRSLSIDRGRTSGEDPLRKERQSSSMSPPGPVHRSSIGSRQTRPSLSRYYSTSSARLDSKPNGRASASLPSRNPVGVQLLTPSLRKQIFPYDLEPPSEAATNIAIEHLTKHDLGSLAGSTLPETTFTLPPLQGPDVDHHFWRIGAEFSQPYLNIAKRFADAELPPMPEYWVTDQPGWTRYDADGSWEAVEGGPADEDMITFDVETLPHISPYAIMAVAASPRAWYSWLSPYLLRLSPSPAHLIPLPSASPRIVVGHNVGYDRARLQPEYSLERTPNRFLDTMALHVAVRGISSPQRPAWQLHKREKARRLELAAEASATVRAMLELEDDPEVRASLERYEAEELAIAQAPDLDDEVAERAWQDVTSSNSLANVHALYCPDEPPMQKETRDVFMQPSSDPETLAPLLPQLLAYCANDVAATHSVYRKTLPAFLDRCPHPVSFAGMLGMGNAFLPVDESWERYLCDAEGKYRELEDTVLDQLAKLAKEAKSMLMDGSWKGDPWLEQLDWTPKKPRVPRGEKRPMSTLPPPPDASPSTPATRPSSSSLPTTPSPRRQSTSGDDPRIPTTVPRWYSDLHTHKQGLLSQRAKREILPALLRLSYHGNPVVRSDSLGWVGRAPRSASPLPEGTSEVALSPSDRRAPQMKTHAFFELPKAKQSATLAQPLQAVHRPLVRKGVLTSAEGANALLVYIGGGAGAVELVRDLAGRWRMGEGKGMGDAWREMLDWSPVPVAGTGIRQQLLLEAGHDPHSAPTPQPAPTTGAPECSSTPPAIDTASPPPSPASSSASDPSLPASSTDSPDATSSTSFAWWPKWYWDLDSRKKRVAGRVDVTPRSRVSPLLLKLRWQGYPIFHSRAHGWTFRVPRTDIETAALVTRQKELTFAHSADERLLEMATSGDFVFFKIPHKDGEEHNVGNPLAKSFIKAFENGTLTSEYEGARQAIDLNAQCSYWISARERVLKQMVIWDRENELDMGFGRGAKAADEKKFGMILPQVITMGTVTRRAIERTWLTASNAKKNRVGSELKAMVRAPPGYSFVGADVDSEELWICSVMGDAQFGLHGATAVGWMTLEGTKAAGTDLHSVSARILGITRDQAKVFNYSRIYGAGQKHAVQLLLQSNPTMTEMDARQRAADLYAATKGNTINGPFRRKFWWGGSESYVFNMLEQVATSDAPRTPALGCSVTAALSIKHLPKSRASGSNFMTSRVNWVVQSSGVDYLHLLIVAMEHLIREYKIDARYLISVHDELRFLVKDEDRYRLALALQVANVWTRSLFSFKLGMDDLPQSVAFFSAVDVDHIFRKEVDMPCVTPSHPNAIPPGESLTIEQTLEKTSGTLHADGGPMEAVPPLADPAPGYAAHSAQVRPDTSHYLQAQSASSVGEIRSLDRAYRAVTRGAGQSAQQSTPRYTPRVAVDRHRFS